MARPRRVTLLIDSMGPGGAQQQMVRLAQCLADVGIAPSTYWYNSTRQFHGLPDGMAGGVLPKRSLADAAFWRSLRRVVAEAELVHAWMSFPGLYAGLAAIVPGAAPVVHATRCSPDLFATDPKHARATLAAVALSRAVTVNSRLMTTWLTQRGVPEERIRYLPNLLAPHLQDRVPSTPEQRRDLLTALGLDPARGPPIVCLGRFDANKNQVGLVRALAQVRVRGHVPQLPPLLLAGDVQEPERRDEVLQTARALGVEVHVVAPVTDVATLLEAARISVLASHSEGTPNVVLEGLAVGALTVSTRVGEVADLVRDGETGLLCAARDEGDLADALERALRMAPAAVAAMGERARLDVRRRFAAKEVTAGYAEFYGEVLERRWGRIGVGVGSRAVWGL